MVVDQDRIFVTTNSESATLLHHRELCSFGSGTWCDGADAVETMESDSKWISGAVSFETPIVLERKKVLSHLQGVACLEKPTPLRQLLTMLEDAGEVRVGYSHHTVDLPQDSIKSEKALCFAIDAKQQDDAVEPPKKKQKNIPKKAR
ncbi:unnamed protein product [Durusdinium trenchii]|uniref:Uncharacterized protein n=1 Tax=Durusdinium trenchii TaxID=1381693 RepID=A0ABP0MRE7_9DINO